MKKYAFILSLLFSFMLVANLTAEIPKRIHFQAYLVDADGGPINKNVSLVVKLFDGEKSNYALYVNSSSDRNVKVENGFLNYYINDLYGDIFSNQLWVELTVDGVVLEERIPLTSSPYSFNSLNANKAKVADTATFAKGLAHNSVTTNHIVNGTIKGVNIEGNQITPDKLVLDDQYDWKGVHTYTSTGVNMELNRKGYAINVVKGTVKVSVMEVDTINTENIAAKTVSANEIIIDKHTIKSDNNGLFIGTTGTSSISGLIFKDGILRYTQSPVFNSSSDNNSIITKNYVDANITNLEASLNTNVSKITGIINANNLVNHNLVYWSGQKLESSSILFNNNKLYYPLTPVYNSSDGNALTTKNYVDANVYRLDTTVSAIVSDVANLTSDLLPHYLPLWNGNKFNNSSILFNNNKLYYSQNPTYNVSDGLALTTKSYVDVSIEDAVNDALIYVNNGIYSSLTTNYIAKWDGSEFKFVNSSITENSSKDTLLLGVGITNGLIKVGDVSFRITPSGGSHYTDIFNVNHLHSIGISANVIEASSILTDNAKYLSSVTSATNYLPFVNNELTFASKGYVDYTKDLLEYKIDNDSIDGSRIKDNTITNEKIESLDGSKIWEYTITGGEHGQIANNTIKSGNIDDWAIQTRHLENSSVTTSKIADNSVTTTKIADNSVTTTKIADNSVTTTKIADNSVTTTKIADNSVTTTKIADGSITNSKLNVSKIDYIGNATADFMPATATATTLTTKGYVDVIDEKLNTFMSDSIDGSKIKDYTITEPKLANNSVSTRTLQNLAVSTEKIGNGAVTNEKIGDDAVNERTILNGSITTDKIANGNVTNPKIGNDAVDERTIVDGAITTDKIRNGAVTDSKLKVSKIVYEGNDSADFYMPTRRISDDLWDDSILTTHSLVRAYYEEALDYTERLSFHLFNVHQWDASRIAPNSIHDYHIITGAIRDGHLLVNNIQYSTNLAANNYMPAVVSDRTLTTKGYVDNTIKDNIRNISSGDANPTIKVNNNTSPTAIKVERGNVVFSYMDVAVANMATYTDLEGFGNNSVININNITGMLHNQVYLPRTGIQAGQILHISNSTNLLSLDAYNGTILIPEPITGGSIPIGQAVSFIAINTASGIKWIRLN